jgi:PAS domain S-box-containing protein
MKAVGGGNGDDPRSGGPADIAARLAHAEARAREVEERYTLATSAALEGIYEWIVDAGRLVLSERAKQFFAFAGEGLTPAAWNERIHPDDFAGYRAVIAAHFRGDTAHLEHEYRIRDAEGGYRWILDRGVGVRGAGGRVTRVVGALSDINDRKLAEIELEAARDRAEAALRQQSAVSEILRLMSGSPNDAQPVFDLVARRAGNLCGAEVAIVSRYEGGRRIELAAIHGVIPQAVSVIRGLYPMDVAAESLTARAVRGSGPRRRRPCRRGLRAQGVRTRRAIPRRARRTDHARPPRARDDLRGARGPRPVRRLGGGPREGVCRPGRDRHRECAPVSRNRRKEPPARSGKPPQERISREHVA